MDNTAAYVDALAGAWRPNAAVWTVATQGTPDALGVDSPTRVGPPTGFTGSGAIGRRHGVVLQPGPGRWLLDHQPVAAPSSSPFASWKQSGAVLRLGAAVTRKQSVVLGFGIEATSAPQRAALPRKVLRHLVVRAIGPERGSSTRTGLVPR